jgi:DNA modification methylase
MATWPDDSIDLVVTSPPYNMRTRIRNGCYTTKEKAESFSVKYDHFNDALNPDDYFNFNKQVLNDCLRVSSLVFYNVQFLTGNKIALFRLIGQFANTLKEIIVWDKVVAQPAMHSGVLNSQFEVILVFDKHNSISREFKNASFERGTLSNLWSIPKSRSVTTEHRASFPTSLAERIINNFSHVGDIILDPFIGTGTTALAAIKLKRRYIGIDISKEYVEISRQRIHDATRQVDLFSEAI